MTTIDASLAALVARLGRTAASGMDGPAVLDGVCATLPAMIGAAGAVIMLAGHGDAVAGACHASDDGAGWVGEAQRRAGHGPLVAALRTGRVQLTPDMTRIGPPELAATAAECGLTSSLVLPMELRGARVAALQLLGDARRPVGNAHAEPVRPLLEVLTARLVDARALLLLTGQVTALREAVAGARRLPGPVPVDLAEVATAAIPVTPERPVDAAGVGPGSPTAGFPVVPAPDGAVLSRSRRPRHLDDPGPPRGRRP